MISGRVATLEKRIVASGFPVGGRRPYSRAGEFATPSITYEATDGQGGVTADPGQLVVDGLDRPFTWYADADGFGVDDLTAYVAPAGTSGVAGDADDADATVYPGAPEINELKDNDQDGSVDENNPPMAPATDAALVDQDQGVPDGKSV